MIVSVHVSVFLCIACISLPCIFQVHLIRCLYVYQCPVCDAKFEELSEYNRHMTENYNELFYTCPLCGQVFYTSVNVGKHLKIHAGENYAAKHQK